MKYLIRSNSQEFKSLNTYTRTKVDGEPCGFELKEDAQTYKYLQEYDKKHGTSHAEYYNHFHNLHYWNDAETQWSREIYSNRRTDIMLNCQRCDISELDDSKSITHTPTYKLDELPKDSSNIRELEKKPKYGMNDYISLKSSWADRLITLIDHKKGNTKHPQSEVPGVVYCTRTKLREYNKESFWNLWVASKFTPTKIYREFFRDQRDAEFWVQNLKTENCFDMC